MVRAAMKAPAAAAPFLYASWEMMPAMSRGLDAHPRRFPAMICKRVNSYAKIGSQCFLSVKLRRILTPRDHILTEFSTLKQSLSPFLKVQKKIFMPWRPTRGML
jgi:hypothetical protein